MKINVQFYNDYVKRHTRTNNCLAHCIFRFLEDLRSRQRQSVLIESISDIITNHVSLCKLKY